MTESAIPMRKVGKVELKVKAASLVTFVFWTVVLSFLGTTATDYVSALPDWLEVPALSLLGTAATYAGGYFKSSRPANLSASTIVAAQEWLNAHMPRR